MKEWQSLPGENNQGQSTYFHRCCHLGQKKDFRSQEIKDRPWLLVSSLGNFEVWSISHTIKSQRETNISTFLLLCFTITSTEVSTAIFIYTTKPHPWGILFYTVYSLKPFFHEHSNKRITRSTCGQRINRRNLIASGNGSYNRLTSITNISFVGNHFICLCSKHF